MANTHSATFHDVPVAGQVMSQSPARTAYGILHFTFTVAPIVAGLDKFFHLLANWDMYLAPWIAGILPMSAHAFMMLVGAIEIIAGLIVAFRPKVGAWIVCAWLFGIIINLVTYPGFFDIALRDLGLCLAAAALGVLSREWDR
jgi:hypothetical protein